MKHEPFRVEVITEAPVTTTQRIITAILTVYYLLSASSIAAVLWLTLRQS